MDFNAIVNGLVEAFKGGQWQLFASFVCMMIVFVVTKSPVASAIKGPAKVWLAACCGVVMAVCTTLATGGTVSAAVMAGVNVGFGAAGLWQVVKRKLDKKPIDANEDGVLDELK